MNRLIVLTGVGMLASVFAPWASLHDPWGSGPESVRGFLFIEGMFVTVCAIVIIVAGGVSARSRSARSIAMGMCALAAWISLRSILNPTSLLPHGIGYLGGQSRVEITWGLWFSLTVSVSGMLAVVVRATDSLRLKPPLTADR